MTPRPSFFTLNPTPSILHSASFNFQPYSRGWSLTSKKPFLFCLINVTEHVQKIILKQKLFWKMTSKPNMENSILFVKYQRYFNRSACVSVCLFLTTKTGLSRVTLEISSGFSSNFISHNPYSGCWDIATLGPEERPILEEGRRVLYICPRPATHPHPPSQEWIVTQELMAGS